MIGNNYHQDRSIYLYMVNRELHDAVKKKIDINMVLSSIRLFSILSGQILFCNVSQVHEVFFNNSEVLRELIELNKAGRFIAHSDYGSYEEFRESRREKFSFTINRHPGFFENPCPELHSLSHSSMGRNLSTTSYIERSLRLFIDRDNDSSLNRTLSVGDLETLRNCSDLIQKTLNSRDQKALTFDAFERMSNNKINIREEGVIRRSLSEIYIDSYIGMFRSVCIWGFDDIAHFESFELLCAFYIKFAKFVIKETGIDDFLSRDENYGQIKRISMEGTYELSCLRESYARLSSVIDNIFGDNNSRYSKKSSIDNLIQKISASGVMRAKKSASSYQDALLIAGESLVRSTQFIESEFLRKENFPDNRLDIIKNIEKTRKHYVAVPEFSSIHAETPEKLENIHVDDIKNESNFNKISGDILKKLSFNNILLVPLISYALPYVLFLFFGFDRLNSFAYSIFPAIIIFITINYFNPLNYHRRTASFILFTLLANSIDYKFKTSGEYFGKSFSFEFGSPNNFSLSIALTIIFILLISIDYLNRKKK